LEAVRIDDVPESPVLVITGASSGIGATTARAAVAAGYDVVLAARSAEKLAGLAEETGGLAVPTDVGVWEDNEALIARALERYARVDAVFANAGFAVPRLELSEHSQRWLNEGTDDWREMLLTNVLGAAYTARAAIPALIESRGHLVLTSSVVGRRIAPGSMYSCSKVAVTAMGDALRQDLIGTGVRVTVIEPGSVDTPFFAAFNGPPPESLAAEDIARAVLFVLGQPPQVDINELLIRPTGQAF
jgi:NADP-dependent 3-hydroxy acid dehydrogenase YdfG